jgi:hypothetical protein
MKKITLIAPKSGAMKLINNLHAYKAQIVNMVDSEEPFSLEGNNGRGNGTVKKKVISGSVTNPKTGKREPDARWRHIKDARLVVEESPQGQTRIDVDETLANLEISQEELMNTRWKAKSLEHLVRCAIGRRLQCR